MTMVEPAALVLVRERNEEYQVQRMHSTVLSGLG